MAGNQIPDGAEGMAVFVMLYSFVNVIAALTVIFMYARQGDRLGLIPLCAYFMVLSIVASIVQQIHYIKDFRQLKLAAYEFGIKTHKTGSAQFTGTYTEMDKILFVIQFYSYNVQALMFLFWVTGLFRSAWRLRISWIDRKDHVFSACARLFAIVFPACLIGLARLPGAINSPTVFLILSNLCLAGGIFIGMGLLVLVLTKYLSIRRRLGHSNSARSGLFARLRWRLKFSAPESGSTSNRGASSHAPSNVYASRTAPRKPQQTKYDKWLIFRFSICFTILCIFQAFNIFYQVIRYDNNKTMSTATEPDYSVATAIGDEAFFMPGVTTGLLIFMVFGTTGPCRAEYSRWFGNLIHCGSRRRIAEPALTRSDSVLRLTNVNASQTGRNLNEWQDSHAFNPTMSKNRDGKSLGAEYTVTINSHVSEEPESPPGGGRISPGPRGNGRGPVMDPNSILVSHTFTTNHVTS